MKYWTIPYNIIMKIPILAWIDSYVNSCGILASSDLISLHRNCQEISKEGHLAIQSGSPDYISYIKAKKWAAFNCPHISIYALNLLENLFTNASGAYFTVLKMIF